MDVAETGYYHTVSSISQLYSSITSSSAVEKIAEEEVNNIVVENTSLSEAVKDIKVDDSGINVESVSEIVKDVKTEDPVTEVVTLSEAVKDIEVVTVESIEESKNDDTTEAKAEYKSDQTELVEITVVPVDSEETTVKDVTLELVDNIVAEEENSVEGDLGQSDPEDQDMYSTRS